LELISFELGHQVLGTNHVQAAVMDHWLLVVRVSGLVHLSGHLSLSHEERTSGADAIKQMEKIPRNKCNKQK
jgi:hypothetical protein